MNEEDVTRVIRLIEEMLPPALAKYWAAEKAGIKADVMASFAVQFESLEKKVQFHTGEARERMKDVGTHLAKQDAVIARIEGEVYKNGGIVNEVNVGVATILGKLDGKKQSDEAYQARREYTSVRFRWIIGIGITGFGALWTFAKSHHWF